MVIAAKVPFPQPEQGPASEIIRLVRLWTEGDRAALDELLTLLYDDLRNLTERFFPRGRKTHTLQPTAVVHEVYLRLVARNDRKFENQRQFFAFLVKVIRSVLADHARAKLAKKRGKGTENLQVDETFQLSQGGNLDLTSLLGLIEAIEDLEKMNPRQARVVELRFIGGLSNVEVANVLEVSTMTVKRDWRLARRWLSMALGRPGQARTVPPSIGT